VRDSKRSLIEPQRAFTLAETLAVLAIVAALAALLFPVLAAARSKPQDAACLSNLHQIGLATQLYMVDHDDRYPVVVNAFTRLPGVKVRFGRPIEVDPFSAPTPPEVLSSYVRDSRILRCPRDAGWLEDGVLMSPKLWAVNGGSSYLFAELFDGQTPSIWKDPANCIWASDNLNWHTPDVPPGDFAQSSINALFYDWHVARIKNRNAPTYFEG
jgi:prepilin-type N-terminal cleavage/methylation domain-containing protein/prepilin-type processing-associated H-X9-DG protein